MSIISGGEEQLSGYLDEYHLKRGYMVSFNFNKKKQVGVHKFTYSLCYRIAENISGYKNSRCCTTSASIFLHTVIMI